MTTLETSWVHPLILEKKSLDAQADQLRNLQTTNERAIQTAVKQAAYRAVINTVWWAYEDTVMRWKIYQIKQLTGSNYTDAYIQIIWKDNLNTDTDNGPFIETLQEINKMNDSNSHIKVTHRSKNNEELVVSVQWKVVDLLWLLADGSSKQ